MTRAEDKWNLTEHGSEAIVPSPRGTYFFYVTWHGDLDCDCNPYELTVFASRDVARSLERRTSPPAPLRTITRRPPKLVGRQEGIGDALWFDDTTIEFRAADSPDSPRQLYHLNVVSGELKTLIRPAGSEELVLHTRYGDSLIYMTVRTIEETPHDYPLYALTAARVDELIQAKGVRRSSVPNTYISYAGRPAWQLPAGYSVGTTWSSPDTRHLIMLQRPDPPPPEWSVYGPPASEQAEIAQHSKALNLSPELRYMWVDADHQRAEPVFDAPMGWQVAEIRSPRPQVFWSSDSRTAVFVNQIVTQDHRADGSKASSGQDSGMAAIVSVDVSSRHREVLEPLQGASGMRVKDVSLRTPGKEFLVRHEQGGKPAPGTIYTYRNSRWVPRTVDASVQPLPPETVHAPRPTLAGGISVQLKQSANDPPAVVASRKGREITLTPPDPALKDVWVARIEPFRWQDRAGITHTSGLLLPRRAPPAGERLPLVIQLTPEAYQPQEFYPDGLIRTAFAAQSMVARDMVVLNLDTRDIVLDLAKFTDWIESAAAAVAQAHPVDLNRIGLVGFSRSGYLIRYEITHPRKLIPAAVVIADSFTGAYQLILSSYATDDLVGAHAYDSTYGGPFYESKASWLEREVSFNVDRVQTPVLFADNNDDAIALVVDTIGAFKAARKPFDYVILPEGDHQLWRPRQRDASLELTADWMAFWLQGKEYPRADKAERYARWRAQRELHPSPQHGSTVSSAK